MPESPPEPAADPDQPPTARRDLKAKTYKGLAVLTWLKIAAVVVAVVLLAIVFMQNTATVQTNILFMSVEMPRIVLLLITLAVGFVAGTLFAGWMKRRG